ncbi:MAG: helix-turn-helix transcriptional regulator [Spirochaetaceae bacterium]|jgi:DNA-binding HxlR family transcriptional regulator|nr:helix-turn-helix transcriptional regulator [Spirochaetaceae bacterium]
MTTKAELPVCPVATTVNLIGNKWKLLILRDLLSGTRRFGELRKSVAGISQKVLTDNLREMEADGLVNRAIFAEIPPRVEYSLSDLGNSLRPIINDMEEWGKNYRAMVLKSE